MMIPEGVQFTVCWLIHNNGDCPVLEHLMAMYLEDKAFFASAVDVLGKLQSGEFHQMPWTRPLKGKAARGLLEARVMGGPNRQLARFPFFYDGRTVVLLYGFTKDDGDTPPKFVAKAKLYKDLIIEERLQYEEADFSLFQQYA